jgi:hypothetical protein
MACLVVLSQNAAIENDVNTGVRDLDRPADFKHVPIPDPEIKLTVYGCRSWGWRRWIRKDARAPQVVTREKHNSRNNADPPPLDSLMLFDDLHSNRPQADQTW